MFVFFFNFYLNNYLNSKGSCKAKLISFESILLVIPDAGICTEFWHSVPPHNKKRCSVQSNTAFLTSTVFAFSMLHAEIF